ncbi:MAG: DUF998 domain-containing protein [Mycobacteriaceae bacterium]
MTTTGTSAAAGGEVSSRIWRGPKVTRALLVAGPVSLGVYVVGDLLSGLLYEGYSWADQAISELSAYGSPVRPLMLVFLTTYGLLGLALSVGLWRAGDRNQALRWVGVFLFAAGVFTLPLHPFFPMSSRGMETGFNDTMHIILTGVFSLLVFAAMVSGAVAYRGWFRLYSIGSLLVIMVAGWSSATAIQGIADNNTPWAGAFERINAYVYIAWVAGLAVKVMRRTLSDAPHSQRRNT